MFRTCFGDGVGRFLGHGCQVWEEAFGTLLVVLFGLCWMVCYKGFSMLLVVKDRNRSLLETNKSLLNRVSNEVALEGMSIKPIAVQPARGQEEPNQHTGHTTAER